MKKSNKTKEKGKRVSKLSTIFFIIKNVIYFGVFIPLIIITSNIAYQTFKYPEKVPNIFGYKFFMMVNDQRDGVTEYGDLVFTKIIDIEEYEIGDVVAFRNGSNTVTVHKIIEINTSIADKTRVFTMQTIENETDDTKFVRAINVEGKMVHKISKLGTAVLIAQEPLVLLLAIIIVLIIGLIAYYIAQKLDERDMKRELEEMEHDLYGQEKQDD